MAHFVHLAVLEGRLSLSGKVLLASYVYRYQNSCHPGNYARIGALAYNDPIVVA